MVEDIIITQENGDIYSAVSLGEEYWLLSWPEGDARFYGTSREARKKLDFTYTQLQEAGASNE